MLPFFSEFFIEEESDLNFLGAGGRNETVFRLVDASGPLMEDEELIGFRNRFWSEEF
jgi:hypothetical protein